jgi:hypothetical protein
MRAERVNSARYLRRRPLHDRGARRVRVVRVGEITTRDDRRAEHLEVARRNDVEVDLFEPVETPFTFIDWLIPPPCSGVTIAADDRRRPAAP